MKAAPMKRTAFLLALGVLALPIPRVTAQPFTVVNVIPNKFSGDTAQNRARFVDCAKPEWRLCGHTGAVRSLPHRLW